MKKKPEITLSAVHYIYVINFQLESLLSTYHIFSYFDFHSLFPVKKYKSNQSFSCKALRLAFSFLPAVSFEIFTAGFSSQILIFPPVHWLKKSDYSSLAKTEMHNKACEFKDTHDAQKLGESKKRTSTANTLIWESLRTWVSYLNIGERF